MASIKKNFAYNLILTFCGYLFPLVTFPYVSRVLGVQNIGICDFADSIINYFVLFSMLGVASFGVREIARVRDSFVRRSYVFSNLIAINLATTFLAIVVLVVCTYTIPKLTEYKPFLLVGIAKIIFNMFLIEWFYQGMQDFKYITIRSLAVRFIYVILVFVFVHDQDDALVYFFLTVPTGFMNAGINWVYSRRFVKFYFKKLNLKSFVIPVFAFGYYRILTSMYTTFNTVFLGFSTNDVEVGYFTTATKLYFIIMSVFSALTSVMIPRVCEYLHEGKIEKLQWISDETLTLVWSCSLPIIFFCQFCAPDVIWLLSGSGYEGAINPFRIVIFLLMVIGTEQIIIQQFLMASTKNKPILVVSSVGAVVGVLFNIFLTPCLGAIGSAIAWGTSEVSVLLVGLRLVKRDIGINVGIHKLTCVLLWSLLYLVPLYIVHTMHLNLILNICLSLAGTLLVFGLINLLLNKNQQMLMMLQGIYNKITQHK